MADQKIVIPDIGTDDEVEVIEINVKVGDSVSQEDTLITLESEKASMEIPSPSSGKVIFLSVNVGDKVKTGSDILVLDTQEAEASASEEVFGETSNQDTQKSAVSEVERMAQVEQSVEAINVDSNSQPKTIDVIIPDIGTDSKVDVIEIQVVVGQQVAEEDALITLESEKASMDIPAPRAGTVKEIKLKVGDKVGQGDLVLLLETVVSSSSSSRSSDSQSTAQQASQSTLTQSSSKKAEQQATNKPNLAEHINIAKNNKYVYASPSIRRFANDLGVDLTKVQGTGRKNRILKTDIELYVKGELAKTQSGAVATSGSGLGLEVAKLPEIDFSKFGEVSEKPLARIKKLSAANLHRNWVVVPHVTQFDDADITDMESFRQKYKKQAEANGCKLTPLVFLMRAAAQALKLMPQFNVSLSNDGTKIIQKHYYHIGIAVDTPNGLVVPVVRDVDQKGLFQLAHELGEISQKARDGKLTAKDMQGGCFSISSLGGIGGTAFTPIVNVPDVAIMGVSKSQIKPVYQEGEFVPRLMLPLSLSYDHRAIDGADAARFISLFSKLLGDISQLLL